MHLFLLLLMLLGLGACAALRTEPGPVSDNAAVRSLAEQAQIDRDLGRTANAAANLERALRIEPGNASLWQALARLRLSQGEYEQAENLAARANSWAGNDRGLRAGNWRLISEARRARGDEEGAHTAASRAAEFER